MTKTLIISHAQCLDGHCAAWCARRGLGPNSDTTFFSAFYGTEPPSVKEYSQVYVLDFCYSREQILKMARETNLIVLDHHLSAKNDILEDKVPGLRAELTLALFEDRGADIVKFEQQIAEEKANLELLSKICLFDMERSGAAIAWDYFIGGMRSWLVNYVQDGDLWQWKLDRSRAVTAALMSYPKTFEAWDSLSRTPLSDIQTEGHTILRYQERLIEEALDKVKFVTIAGHKVPAVNSAALASEIASRLCEIHKSPFAAVWLQLPNGLFKYSIRALSSNKEIDLIKIAKYYDGGGHRVAASFRSSRLLD